MGIYDHLHFIPEETEEQRADRKMKAVTSALATVHEGWQSMTATVSGLFSPNTVVDEMALLFPNEAQLAFFVATAVRLEGFELFNTSRDTVTTSPVRRQYETMYWFLRTLHGYRLELMVAGAGSPLHDERAYMLAQMQGSDGEFTAASVHASFKCEDEYQYSDTVNVLRANDWEMAQGCQSSYGRFSYWQIANGSVDAPAPAWYLKPRVNLRDTLSREDEASEARATGRE